EKAGTKDIDELLQGPIALTLIKGDAVVAAKTITTFTKEHDILEFRGGIMDGAPLDVESFKAIARLPGRDVLHGQLVGLAASPLTGLVAGLSNLISGLGRQLAQIAEQGLVTGEAPEPEAPVEEPAPEEAPVEEPPADEPSPEPEAEDEAPEAGSDPTDNDADQAADAEGSDPTVAEAEEPEADEEPETEPETETPEED
ncbi:MAG: large subunit ribosomal protein, partial [Solirubrobacterales bacterium]|nr:large subunit ribosomal protein [Solirubrobacterales bacterium]